MATKIPLVDEWKPRQEDILFTNSKNIIVAPLTRFFQVDDQTYTGLNLFFINPKKSYNSDPLRDHTCLYLNYLEAFFDAEKEFYTNMAKIKFMIDMYENYDFNTLLVDINRYILQPSLYGKTKAMVDYNYSLELSYKSANNPQLSYTNDHGKLLMQMSILMNMLIPLITHFAYMRRISDIDQFLLDIYDHVLYAPISNNVDIVTKLYETSISNVTRNEKNNATIWQKQDIRGKDTVIHSMSAVRNIILNIMPKYTFDKNMVSLDYTSIQKSNRFQITDIAYEFSYIALSTSKRDNEDNASDFDRYEANLTKADESLYLASKTNYQYIMKTIEKEWGPFDQNEVNFYIKELKNDNGEVINGFQKQLVFNLFYKYFGDTVSIRAINIEDYVKLILSAKKMLQQNMMAYLPYILSSKVNKIIARKTLNKREVIEMESSQYYPLVMQKFNNEKIKNQILGTIATIITSNFSMIDYRDPSIHGKQIIIDSRMIIEETLLYILLI